MSGFNFGNSHPEVMAACKLAGVAKDRILVGDILKGKTGPQLLAGLKTFYPPQIMEQKSDSHWWDTRMRDIATEPSSGMVWLHLQQHAHFACKADPHVLAGA